MMNLKIKKTAAMAQLFGEAFEVENASEDLMRYRERSHLPLTDNPLQWWKAKEVLPLLSSLAKILMYTSRQCGLRKSFQHYRRYCFCATQCITT